MKDGAMNEQRKGSVHVVGLGSGDYRELTLGTVDMLKSDLPLYLRTARHPSVTWLEQQGIAFRSFDSLYDSCDDFSQLYQQIAEEIAAAAAEAGEIIYAVPGHPLVAERVSEILLQRSEAGALTVRIYPAVGALESVAAALRIDPAQGLVIQDGLDYQAVAGTLPQLIFQVYNRQVAGNLKLTLMESYPDDAEITIIQAAGIEGLERIERMPLYELDRQEWLDHLTSVYIAAPTILTASRFPLDPLAEVMSVLRGENGCPWDQEQDHISLRRYCLEEACEVIAAIDSGDSEAVVDELGDLLLQIAFHAQIGREEGEYDLNDIVAAICSKMIRRHPHVFSDVQVESSEEVLQNWEAIKQQERGNEAQSLLKGVGDGLPALMRAQKLQKKAAGVGFDWPDAEGPKKKVWEELSELLEAALQAESSDAEMEFGDLLFSLVNWSRFLKIDPELALTRSSEKFRQRFAKMEKESALLGKNLISMTLSEMDAIWDSIKRQGKD